VSVDDGWARVWGKFDDARLESALFEYFYLAVNTLRESSLLVRLTPYGFEGGAPHDV
jgi:hypothetical protein